MNDGRLRTAASSALLAALELCKEKTWDRTHLYLRGHAAIKVALQAKEFNLNLRSAVTGDTVLQAVLRAKCNGSKSIRRLLVGRLDQRLEVDRVDWRLANRAGQNLLDVVLECGPRWRALTRPLLRKLSRDGCLSDLLSSQGCTRLLELMRCGESEVVLPILAQLVSQAGDIDGGTPLHFIFCRGDSYSYTHFDGLCALLSILISQPALLNRVDLYATNRAGQSILTLCEQNLNSEWVAWLEAAWLKAILPTYAQKLDCWLIPDLAAIACVYLVGDRFAAEIRTATHPHLKSS